MSSYEKDEFQELKLLKNGLSGLRENLHREIGFFLTTLDNATDPIQVLTSDKGKWLLTNPFSDTTEMINHLVRNISFRLSFYHPYGLPPLPGLMVTCTCRKTSISATITA